MAPRASRASSCSQPVCSAERGGIFELGHKFTRDVFLLRGKLNTRANLAPFGREGPVSQWAAEALGQWDDDPVLGDPAVSLQNPINPSKGSNSLRIKRALCIPETNEGDMDRDF